MTETITKKDLEEILDKKFDTRFAEQDKKLDKSFVEQDKKLDKRFVEQDKKLDKRFVEQDKRFDKKLDAYQATIIEAVDEKFTIVEERLDKLAETDSMILSSLDGLSKRVETVEQELLIVKSEGTHVTDFLKEKFGVKISGLGRW
jgi:chromosome segregation ATPase